VEPQCHPLDLKWRLVLSAIGKSCKVEMIVYGNIVESSKGRKAGKFLPYIRQQYY
jgi:hypothetical protein